MLTRDIGPFFQEMLVYGNHLQPMPPPQSLEGISLQGENGELRMDARTLSTHVLAVGNPGSGKTNAIFQLIDGIRATMGPDDAMLVFDTKGDFLQKFHRPGDVVIANDNTARNAQDARDYWNLFAELCIDGKDAVPETAQEIARMIFADRSRRSNNPFFPSAAQDLLSCILILLERSFRDEGRQPDNTNLFQYLNAPLQDLLDDLKQDPELMHAYHYIAGENEQSQGVLAEMYQLVHSMLIGNFAKEGNISVRGALRRRQGRALFIEYDIAIGKVLEPIYRLMIDLAFKESLGRNRAYGNVYVVLDEFGLLPSLQLMENALNFGRSCGVKIIAGMQNINQVYDGYGAEKAASLLSAFGSVLLFRTDDERTRNFCAGRFGKKMVRQVYEAENLMEGMREHNIVRNTVEDWDILQLPFGSAIVGLPYQPPFRFDFLQYQPGSAGDAAPHGKNFRITRR